MVIFFPYQVGGMVSRRGHYLIDDHDFYMKWIPGEEKKEISHPDYPLVEEGVPEYIIGEHVLGRCFPFKGLVQIKRGLDGHVKDRVKKHELTHYEHPEWSEWEVRKRTGTEKPPEDWYL